MTIRLLQAVRVSGAVVPAGQIVSYNDAQEADLVARGAAVYVEPIAESYPPSVLSAEDVGVSPSNSAAVNSALLSRLATRGRPVRLDRPGLYPVQEIPQQPLRIGAGVELVVGAQRTSARDFNAITMAGKGWWKSPTPLARASGAAAVGAETVGSYSSIYWPCVIRTDNIANPLGRYYLYYSTDHDAGAGGIAMMYGPTPLGPWTNYGQVFIDTSGGGQTETPWVMWDPYNSNLRLFYHNNAARWGAADANVAVGQQSTLSATSTNGLTWTKDPNFILDIPGANEIHGDGHTGYFCPFYTRNGLFAYSACGGTIGADFVLWECRGPLNEWQTDYVSLGYESHLFWGETPARFIGWHNSFAVESQGALWWIGRLHDFVAGVTPSDSRIGLAPLSADLRHIVNKPVTIWNPTAAWETANVRGAHPFIEDGVLYVYYTCSGNYVGVMAHAL